MNSGEAKIYYNDNDRKIVQWLKQLVYDGVLPKGDVDDRDIKEIKPNELEDYDQVHLFAGIGGWAYGLRMADWPAGRPVWTGSCPCQPFSVAGRGRGTEDERHLWPAFRWLIAQCSPPMVFGEQVASSSGRDWLSGVRSDLETLGYVVGGSDLCAASIGAPHIRQRLWWVANSERGERGGIQDKVQEKGIQDKVQEKGISTGDELSRIELRVFNKGMAPKPVDWTKSIFYPCRDGVLRRVPARRMGDSECGTERGAHRGESGESRKGMSDKRKGSEVWDDIKNNGNNDIRYEGLEVEPSLFPLADGFPQRVGLLRGAGNAIVPQVISKFVQAYMETEKDNDT